MNCGRCDDRLLPEDKLRCSTCNGNFHYGCVNKLESNFRKMSRVALESWKCMQCKLVPRVGSGVVAGSDPINELKSHSGEKTGSELGHASVSGEGSRSESDLDGSSLEVLTVSSLHQMHTNLLASINSQINANFANTNNLITAMTEKVNQCLENYKSLSIEVNTISHDLEMLKKADLVTRIAALELKSSGPAPEIPDARVPPPSPFPSMTVEEAFAEFEDRRRRAPNVMIYGFPEPNAERTSDAIVEDLRSLKESVAKISPDFNELIKRFSRMGPPKPNVCRAVKLVFDSPPSATKFLVANRSKNPPIFSASSDRTELERARLKILREQVRVNNENGEPSTIKYRNGVANVVPLPKASSSSTSKNGN